MKKVVVWGKFDGLHQGHYEFLKNARSLGDELYCVVIPDKAVLDNKGNLPNYSAQERRDKLKELDFIKEVYIDSLEEGLLSIVRLKPDVIALGYDQKTVWEEKLRRHLSSNGINPEYVWLEVYNNGIHSTHLRSKKLI